jgi:hypothetical protein
VLNVVLVHLTPVGGWTCPPLTQTISPCPGLMKCVLAVVSSKFKYSETIDFAISSNNNMYILFSTYILQINLLTELSKRIDIQSNYTNPIRIAT